VAGGTISNVLRRGMNMKKKNENGVRKVSQKKQGIAKYKWLKVVWFKLDEIDERIAFIEKFLGGRESMKQVIADREGKSDENHLIRP